MNMKDFKPKLQKIYHWLKERPSTHIAVFLASMSFVVCFTPFILDLIFMIVPSLNKYTDDGLILIFILAVYVEIQLAICLITILFFFIEIITLFNFKIKKHYYLENKKYNIFWLVSLIMMFTYSFIYWIHRILY